MKEFDEIKKAWGGQELLPAKNAADIIDGAKNRKRGFANKILLQAMSLLASCIAGLIIIMTVHFKMMSTYAGLVIMFLTVFGFSCLKLYELVRLKQIDFTNEPKNLLQQLGEFYNLRKFINTTCISIYFILLNLSFLFYFIETLQPLSNLWIGVSIAAYTAWMLFSYFVLRKRRMKKDKQEVEEMISAVKKLEQAFSD